MSIITAMIGALAPSLLAVARPKEDAQIEALKAELKAVKELLEQRLQNLQMQQALSVQQAQAAVCNCVPGRTDFFTREQYAALDALREERAAPRTAEVFIKTEEYRRAEEFFNSPRLHLHPVEKDAVADSGGSG
jgi:hypothetical protein